MGVFSVIQKIIDLIFQNIEIDFQQTSDFSKIFEQIFKELSKEIVDSEGNLLKILKSKFNIHDPNFDEKLKEILEKLKEDKQQSDQLQGELNNLFYSVFIFQQGDQKTADGNKVFHEYLPDKEGKESNKVDNIVWLDSPKNFKNIDTKNNDSGNVLQIGEEELYSFEHGSEVGSEGEKEQIQEKQKILSHLRNIEQTNQEDKKLVQQGEDDKNIVQQDNNAIESKIESKSGVEKLKQQRDHPIESKEKIKDERNTEKDEGNTEMELGKGVEKLKYQNDEDTERLDDNDLQKSKFYSEKSDDITQEKKIFSKSEQNDVTQEKKIDEGHRKNVFSNFENVKQSEITKEVSKVQSESERIQKIKDIISDSLKISVNSHQRRAVVDTNLGGIRLSIEVQVDFSNKVYISITTPDEGLKQELSNSYNDFKRFMQENNFFLAKFDLNSQGQDGKNNWDIFTNMTNSIGFNPFQENEEKFSYGTILSNVKGRINFVV